MVALGVGGGGRGCHCKEATMGKKGSNVTPAVLRGKMTTFLFSKFLLLRAGDKGFPTATCTCTTNMQ